MGFVQLDNIAVAFGDRTVLSDVSLTVSPKTRMALAGANGSGKSTLMKVAAGLMEPDAGRVILPKGARAAYLPQSGLVHRGRTLAEEAQTAFATLAALAEEADAIAVRLEEGSGDHEALLHRFQEIHETLEAAEYDRRDAVIERVLGGLGFRRDELSSDVETFSGGWQMRIALAKILLSAPDVLLLDEPTNYLDLEAREWLRDYLRGFPGGVLLVSHDRSFLDESVNQTAELLMSRLKIFKGNYSAYEKLRERELADLVERYKRQQEEIERIETFIRRFRYKNTKAAQVQSRVKMLEKMERIEIPPSLKRIRFRFPEAPRSGRTVVRTEGLTKAYGEKTVFSALDLEIERGSRTAVVGVNGAGKTTLLRIVSGNDSAYQGTVTLGSGIVVGYFSQDQQTVLDPDATVLEEAGKGSGEGEGRLRSLLGAFLFSGDDIHKSVGVLSGGEMNRLALLKLLLSPANLLVLDEPTNHLDITAKDVLLDALKDFGGTLLIVSHDRYFLGQVADRVLEIEEGRGTTFLGDYAYYRWRKERKESPVDTPGPVREPKSIAGAEGVPMAEPTAGDRDAQKRRRSHLSKLRREEESLTIRLAAKEEEAAGIRADLELPENYGDPDKAYDLSARLLAVEERIEQITAAWEEAAEALETAERNT